MNEVSHKLNTVIILYVLYGKCCPAFIRQKLVNGINWKIYLNPTAEYKWYSNKIVYYPMCLILISTNAYITYN